MGNSFNIHDYVDLSQISDPRMLAEITRTLEYFASKPEGQAIIRKAAVHDGFQKVQITDKTGLQGGTSLSLNDVALQTIGRDQTQKNRSV